MRKEAQVVVPPAKHKTTGPPIYLIIPTTETIVNITRVPNLKSQILLIPVSNLRAGMGCGSVGGYPLLTWPYNEAELQGLLSQNKIPHCVRNDKLPTIRRNPRDPSLGLFALPLTGSRQAPLPLARHRLQNLILPLLHEAGEGLEQKHEERAAVDSC